MAQSSMSWSSQFTFSSKTLYYNRIPYNNRAERAVEIPLAFEFLARQPHNGKILEVGNVLQHYENALSDSMLIRNRRIVDKFEIGQGIENIDLMDLDAQDKFQTIICISTVEHVGQSCAPTGQFGEQRPMSDREAPLKAIAKIYDLLDVNGRALVTVPFGRLTDGGWYVQFSAEYLDLLVSKYGIPKEALTAGFLKQVAREGWSNPYQLWSETPVEDLSTVRYDTIVGGARAVAVLELTRLAQPFTLNLAVPPTLLVYESSALAKSLSYTMSFLKRWQPKSPVPASIAAP